MQMFAGAPRNTEDLLLDELVALGAENARLTTGGVSFDGDLRLAYRVCLESRVAGRVLLHLFETDLGNRARDDLYNAAREFSFEEHLGDRSTIAVDGTGNHPDMKPGFAGLVVKDAIVDRLRDQRGFRPDVDTKRPDVRFHLYIRRDHAVVSLDLGGGSIHRRGYRPQGGEAPLKENTAAAILLRSDWPRRAKEGWALADPMCGTGTLLIEGLMMACDIAPGLGRRFGFERWAGHDAELWKDLKGEARERAGVHGRLPVAAAAADKAISAITSIRGNLGRARVPEGTQFFTGDFRDLGPAMAKVLPEQTLLVVNPPYGVRLGDARHLGALYASLGRLREVHFPNGNLSVFSGAEELLHQVKGKPFKVNALYNAGIHCHLAQFDATSVPRAREEWEKERDKEREAQGLPPRRPPRDRNEGRVPPGPDELHDDGIEMLKNRLKKNARLLKKYLQQHKISSYRLYDADMPEYNFAVDVYEGTDAHIQEYKAPSGIDPEASERRLAEGVRAVKEHLGLEDDNIHVKVRERHGRKDQYEKQAEEGARSIVKEGGLKFYVNFSDYLDTGLFLDHRFTRDLIRTLAPGARFLNLFAYTGSATVYAADGGAVSSVTADTSNTYLAWAKDNMTLNGFDSPLHKRVRSDVQEYLGKCRDRFDLIFVDPPTFSNNKSAGRIFDIQKDHPDLLKSCAKLLDSRGTIVFSTNFRKFKPDLEALQGFKVEEMTSRTLPKDFARRKMHRTWVISRR